MSMQRTKLGWALWILGLLFKLAFVATAVLLPILGV
jgi:hypothetical protein